MTLPLNGKEFPAWQNTDNADYYVVYVLNADGEKGLYQYDAFDKTYQRFAGDAGPADDGDSKKESSAEGLWGKIQDFIQDFLDIIVIIAAAVFLILLIMLIVTAVKMRHRDMELDDLYDEYGIDLDEEEEQKPAKVKKKAATVKKAKGGPTVRRPAQIDLDDEEDSDNFKDYEEEDDEIIDDLDELLSSQPKKKHGHMDPDDIFKVDLD